MRTLLALLLLAALGTPRVAAQTDSVAVYRHRAEIAVDFGDFTGALAEYRHAARLAPADNDLRFRIGLVLGWMGKYEAAIAELRPLLAADPDNRDVLAALARVLAWSGQGGRAEALVAEARSRAPGDQGLLGLMAQLRYFAGDLGGARRWADQALAIDPAEPTALSIDAGIRSAMAVRSTTSSLNPWDSDDTYARVTRQHVRWGLAPDRFLAIDASATRSGNRTTSASETAFTSGARFEADPFGPWKWTAGLSVAFLPDGLRPGLNASAAWVDHAHTVSLFSSRYPLLDTPFLIASGSHIWENGVVYAHTGTLRTVVDVGFAALPSTRRLSMNAQVSRAWKWGALEMEPGLRLRVADFTKDATGSGFFAPDFSHQETVRLDLRTAPVGRYRFGAGVEAGRQQYKRFNAAAGDPTLTWAADVRLGIQPTPAFDVEVAYLYSTLLSASTQDRLAGDYWVRSVEVRIRLRFGS